MTQVVFFDSKANLEGLVEKTCAVRLVHAIVITIQAKRLLKVQMDWGKWNAVIKKN